MGRNKAKVMVELEKGRNKAKVMVELEKTHEELLKKQKEHIQGIDFALNGYKILKNYLTTHNETPDCRLAPPNTHRNIHIACETHPSNGHCQINDSLLPFGQVNTLPGSATWKNQQIDILQLLCPLGTFHNCFTGEEECQQNEPEPGSIPFPALPNDYVDANSFILWPHKS